MTYTYNPTKPITVANYPLTGNPYQHYYTTRNKPILMAVQHITAGLSDFDGNDGSAESTVKYSSSTATQASYHGIVDADSIIDCLPDSFTAWAQGVKGHNFNSPALSLEIGLLSPDWRKPPSWWVDATIRNAARWWAPRVKRYNIPLRLMTDRDQIDSLIAANKMVGFTEHHTLDPINRTDAGFVNGTTTFPWSLLFSYIRAELGGTLEEDDMPTAREVALEVWGYKGTGEDKDAYEYLRHQIASEAATLAVQLLLAARVPSPRPTADAPTWSFLSWLEWTGKGGVVTQDTVVAMADKVGVDVDEAALAAALAATLGPQLKQLVTDAVTAGGSPDQIADAVVDKLGEAIRTPKPA